MRSYLKFLSRNKLFTAIEFIGLSVALAFVILSFCYVMQQFAVMRENPDRERIYAVGTEELINSYAMKDVIEGKIPEIERITRFMLLEDGVFYSGEQCFKGNVLNCDHDFFDFFEVPLKEGSAERLNEAGVAFVSEKVANKMGKEVMGQQLVVGEDTLRVAGVFSSVGSSLFPEISVIGNIETSQSEAIYRQYKYNYYALIHVFIKTMEGADREAVAQKITEVCEAGYPHGWGYQCGMVRLDEHYFSEKYTGLNRGDRSMLRTMIIIGLLLLVSALINYINLNTSLIGKRAKEMASRRLLGAQKTDIMGKLLLESLVFSLCCFLMGLLIAEAITPLVNHLMKASVPLRVPYTWDYLLYYLLIVVMVSLLAGLIPASIVAKTQPIDVVRGTFRFRSKKVLSKVFIVLQNAIAIVLIALVITMELQMRHLVERPMGVRTENLFFVQSDLDYTNTRTAFVDALRALPCVKEVGSATNIPGIPNISFMVAKMHETEKNQRVSLLNLDEAAFRMLGFEVKERFKEADANSFYMTESTIAGLTGLPLGDYNYDTIEDWRNGNLANEICGVIADFKMLDALHATDNDYVMVFECGGDPNAGELVEIVGDPKEAARAIKDLYAKYSEEAFGTYLEPEHCGFVEEVIATQYDKIRRQMRLIELIMAVSVILSLLGLVAMSTHFASEREKGIAIRKVFGGTMESEIRRNLREYIIMILIANVIAIPIAVWLCGRYLEGFAYRIPLYWWIFAVAAMLSLVIAIGSVLWQIVSVARVNPVTALKKE